MRFGVDFKFKGLSIGRMAGQFTSHSVGKSFSVLAHRYNLGKRLVVFRSGLNRSLGEV